MTSTLATLQDEASKTQKWQDDTNERLKRLHLALADIPLLHQKLENLAEIQRHMTKTIVTIGMQTNPSNVEPPPGLEQAMPERDPMAMPRDMCMRKQRKEAFDWCIQLSSYALFSRLSTLMLTCFLLPLARSRLPRWCCHSILLLLVGALLMLLGPWGTIASTPHHE